MDKTTTKVEHTLKSLDHLDRPRLSPLMADRIYQKAIGADDSEKKQASLPLSWALGLSLLLVINLGLLYFSVASSGSSKSNADYFISTLSY